MSRPIVFPINKNGVAGVDVLHDLVEVGVGSLDKKMIIHEHVSVQQITISFLGPLKDRL
jgi:hypothetical protein